MCVVRIDFFTDDDTVTRNGLQFIEDVRRNGFILGHNRYLLFFGEETVLRTHVTLSIGVLELSVKGKYRIF